MFLPGWLQQFAQQKAPRSKRRRADRVCASMRRRVRPRLEILEDRLTPSSDVLMAGTTASSFPTFTTNQPSGAIVVQLQDGNGNAVAAAGNLTVNLSSSSSTGQFLDLSGKALTNSSVTIPTGSSFALFEYEDSQAGNPTITFKTSDSSASGHTTFNVHNVLTFTTPIQVLAPNQVSGTITVQLQDGNGTAIKAASNTTINLSSSSSTGKFLDTSGKPLTTDSITIAAGSSTASFEYEDSQAQSFASTLFANTSDSSLSGSQEVNVGIPMVITTPSQTLTAGQASNLITIQLDTAATSNVTINLTSTSSGGKFLNTSGNPMTSSNGVFSVLIPSGSSSASFKYQDSQTGAASLLASNASDPTQSAHVVEYVGLPGQAFATIVSPSQAIALNQHSQLFTVQLQNNGDPITTPSNLALNLSSSSSTGKFLDSSGNPLANPSIIIPAGSSSATFEYEDSHAGLVQLTASQTNATIFGIPQLEDVGGVKLAFSTSAQSFSPGQASQPITVQLQDSNGNAIMASNDVTVSLQSSVSSGSQFLDTSGKPLINPTITLAAGSSSTSFEYESTWGGKPTLTASLQAYAAFNAPPLSATQQETIQGATALAFTTSSQIVTAGQTSGIVTVQLRDSSGNPASAPSGATIDLSGGITAFFDANGNPLPTSKGFSLLSVAAGSSTASFTFRMTRAGNDNISASVPGAFSATQAETVNAGKPATLAFQTGPQSLLAGMASGNIIVELTDQYGNAALASSGGVTVNLSSSSSGGHFLSATGSPLASPSVTIASGANSATFEYQDSQAGTPTVTAASTGLTSATQKETITSIAPSISGNPTNQSAVAGNNASFTASAIGVPTPTVQWQVSSDGGKTFTNISGATSTTLTLTSVTTAMNGNKYQAVFTNSAASATTSAATLTVTAAASAPVLTGNPSNQTVMVGQSAAFTASANGSPTPTVQWQVSTNGGVTFTDISGATSATLTLNNVPASMNGNQFRAVFSNSAGSVTSAAVTLTVNTPPSPPPPPPSPSQWVPPVLQVPPLLALLNSLFGGGVETVNANRTENLTDSLFGIPLIVSTFNSFGRLVDVRLIGIDITFLFL